jgi:D-aminopeptidase
MTAVLILADIEGSTGCSCREDAQLFTDGWVRACLNQTQDINLICQLLKEHGATRIRVKDFHRTGYNIFGHLLTPGVELDQGFCSRPVPGIGDVTGFDLLMMTGMHVASGCEGFLPHTLTSRFALIEVNGRPLCEAELFASSVARVGLRPVFFSGCPQACAQAKNAITGLNVYPVEKPLVELAGNARRKQAAAAALALKEAMRDSLSSAPYLPSGPFNTRIIMRDGAAAAKRLRKRWQLSGKNEMIEFVADDMATLYWQLIKLAYLTPGSYRFLNIALKAANLMGYLAHIWARNRLQRGFYSSADL